MLELLGDEQEVFIRYFAFDHIHSLSAALSVTNPNPARHQQTRD